MAHQIGRLRLVVAAGTEVGHRYRSNFDVLHVDPAVPLIVVADGMGDGEGSRMASRTAVDTVVAAMSAEAPTGVALRRAVDLAQIAVRTAGAPLVDLAGCTLTALLAGPEDAWIVQIGDSRAYRLRDGVLELLTVDHTMAWLGAVNGWYAADSAQAARARYHLLRYVGDRARSEPDVLNVSLRPGDVYCLCTDGVTDQVPYQRLASVLAGRDPAAAVGRLLADSIDAGGRDNATVAVVHVSA
ncbi:MAG TPA: protein phosphatase 2C domain-containing protein [Micromonosporaceae bacterium]|nr:protein phosphatase 2C domain-containing protein [Micromonosporaceae bacterium]